MSLKVFFLSVVSIVYCQSSSAQSGTTITTQDLAGLPACAQNCLSASQSLQAQGTCSTTDIKCLCSNVEYINVVACCLDSKCSPADQQKAVSFNSNLCQRVNITIPNFLGCAITSMSGGSTITSTTQGQTSSSFMPSTTGAGSVIAASPIAIPGNAAAVSYTGGLLWTGTCTTPAFASATLNSGNVIQYPLEGCSSANPGCCPFDIDEPGPLKVCPRDYIATAGACCPSGWSVYTAALYGQQTPCYSVPPVPLVAPTGTTGQRLRRLLRIAPRAASTTTITNQIYTMRYPLIPSGTLLSVGAKVGIAVGAAAGAVIIGVLLYFLIRHQRARSRARQFNDASTVFSGPSLMGGDKSHRQSFMAPSTGYHQGQHPINELPSPLEAPGEHPQLTHNQLWLSNQAQQHVPTLQSPPNPHLPAVQPLSPLQAEPTELHGSTHINEHHPAYERGTQQERMPSPRDEKVLPVAPGMVSPM